MRQIELSFPDGDRVEPILKAAARSEPLDFSLSPADERGRRLLRLVFRDGEGQKCIDSIQAVLEGQEDWRLVVLPVEASLPTIEADVVAQRTRKRLALREELYQDVEAGARLSSDFLLLTVLSTVVVVFGLNADNIAAVIGAMVIAPLLGPILAFSFGSALGDLSLMLRASRTALAGLAIGMGLSALLGLIFGVNLDSLELLSRADVGLDSTALALAAGAAAALSISAGLPAALVGVMVAVALLPPAAAAGMLAGAGETGFAARAALLLAINVVSVNLAALTVYWAKGVRPRTWLERRSAKRSVFVNGAVWLTLIVLLTLLAARYAA